MGPDGEPFSPGDHLRVRRSFYYHHGIYTDGHRVVQFGGGNGTKRHNRIEEVPLEGFSDELARIEVVDQSRLRWIGLWRLPPAYPPGRIVARARCLQSQPSDGGYNLIARNCETVALWRVCGMRSVALATALATIEMSP